MFGSSTWVLVILTVTASVAVWGDQPSTKRLTGMNACNSKRTCHECIQTPSCAWCGSANFTRRCFQRNAHTKPEETCPRLDIIDPDTDFFVVRDDQLTSEVRMEETILERESSYTKRTKNTSRSYEGGSFHEKVDAVQIQPQEVNLKLRINQVHRIKFAYSQAEDYPVDLYYLMDLSKSMEDDKKKLSDLGQLLVDTMRNMSTNFRLGFGSFVDKVVMPYVSTVPAKLIRPCSECETPYGYKHVMPLSDNADEFANLVRSASVSGNLDAPEGGFDALMQAIVCKQKIGWRNKARRLLVFSTDAGFHYAGDGKLGGIIKPNDGECHLDGNGLYTHSLEQDYPSISQINYKVKKHSVNVIWAVTHEQIGIYESLTKHVQGSSCEELSPDSRNVVTLIKTQYESISSSVEMKDSASKIVKVRYFSNCMTQGPEKETSKCSGLKAGVKVDFTAEIEVTSCPKNRSEWKQQFNIYPVGLHEKLVVNLEILCDCECEHGGPMYIKNYSGCSGHGTSVCGVCECYDGFFGEKCQCDTQKDATSTDTHSKACMPNNQTLVECSGRGTCTCGICECDTKDKKSDERVWGKYCECDNFSCDRHEGKICSDHGTCDCGNCICDEGYSGPNCNCIDSTETCLAPGAINGTLCSGYGKCVCGRCVCDEDKENRHSGLYCDKCSSCPSLCDELKPCVECKMYSGENNTVECNEKCNGIETPIPVEVVNADVDGDDVLCFDKYEDCKYQFVYHYNTTKHLIIHAQKEVDCPPRIFVLGIVLGVMAAIVLIGLAFLLLWKLLTTIHDRREFARFEKERMMAKWDTGENPIYKQATSTFKNPTYAGK